MRSSSATSGLLVSTIYNLVFRGVLTSSLSRFGGNSDMEHLASLMQGGTGVVMNLILGPVFIVVGLFVSAGIFHLALLALGGAARGFEGTFRVAGYSQAASIFNIIPGCGGLVGLVSRHRPARHRPVRGARDQPRQGGGGGAHPVRHHLLLLHRSHTRGRSSAWPARSAA